MVVVGLTCCGKQITFSNFFFNQFCNVLKSTELGRGRKGVENERTDWGGREALCFVKGKHFTEDDH